MRNTLKQVNRNTTSALFNDDFNTLGTEFSLYYSGKLSESEIFSAVPDVTFVRAGSGGAKDKNGTGWKNLVIKGDNLSALKALLKQKEFQSRVDLIYTDPPFSTNLTFRKGKLRSSTISSSQIDEVAYVDTLNGPGYVEFIRQRLILLKLMLSTQGSIYLHIDYKIGHYVKIIMDEIFGKKHFINDITRIKCNPKNFQRRGYGNVKDLILFYSKTNQPIWHGAVESFSEDDIKRLFPKIDKTGRRYTTTPLHAPGETQNGQTGRKWKNLLPPKGRHWRYPPDELTRLDEQGLIEWSSTGNPRKIIYADEKVTHGKKKQDIWEYKDPPNPVYPTEKNLEMIRSIICASSNPGSCVLDCFAGSGATAIAAEREGRRWILIDSSEAAIRTIKERLSAMNGTPAPYVILETQ